VPVPAPPAASRSTVSSLYKEAEQALRRGDDGAGKQRLLALIRTFPRDVMADSARFELALLANAGGDQREALALIRDILGHGTRGPLVEPARFLRCRVYLKEDRDAAEICLVRFVRDYPRSPHDDVAVRALVELSRAKGQCSKASQLAEMYLQRHPKGSFADEAARVRSQCGE
jgi:TolA-binding protein